MALRERPKALLELNTAAELSGILTKLHIQSALLASDRVPVSCKTAITMTTASERTCHLLQAGAFLKRLEQDHEVPEWVRQEAYRLLRHYPSAGDVSLLAHFEAAKIGSGMLTPDLDPAWLSEYPLSCPRNTR